MHAQLLARRLLIPILALAFCAPVTGCRKIRQKLQEKALEKAGVENVESDEQGQSFTFKGKGSDDKVTFGTTQKIPDGFPAEVPVYPGAKVLGSAASQQQGIEAFTVTLTTDDPVEKVVEFYKSKVPAGKNDESPDLSALGGLGGNLVTYSTDKHRVTVMVNENESATPETGKTALVLNVSPSGAAKAKAGK